MYAYLWNHLPGNTAVRAVISIALFLAVVAVLFVWVFPWLVPLLPLDEVTVTEAGSVVDPGAAVSVMGQAAG